MNHSDDNRKKLPIGIEDFEKLIQNNFYYVDKTALIRDLLCNPAEVSLFTRPRRFGKSLNMSMLKCFFETGADSSVFDGLVIAGESRLCEQYMGKFPVISVSFKGIDAADFETACRMTATVISIEASRFDFLSTSSRLSGEDKKVYAGLLNRGMDPVTVCASLWDLSRLLEKHYGKRVILLIDEYDVPLARAFAGGYYDRMVWLLRNMFGQVLKTNRSLQFAVLTGCMRISRESIFTGLNNLRVLTVADARFDEFFGFTDHEVRELLEYYGFSDFYDTVKEWYDGYQFGNTEVYCPWDVINYLDLLSADRKACPQDYWANSSSNDIVERFVREMDNGTARRELEALVAGETIEKEIRQEITYRDMYKSADNIWSVLFMTGYLTQKGFPNGRLYRLKIPNMEIRDIFTSQIMMLFKEKVEKDGAALEAFCDALQNGDAAAAGRMFEEYLKRTISIRDTFVRRELKENFYHGMLLGILGFRNGWYVTSNRETGDGYGDILVEIEEEGLGIVIEVKYAGDGNLEAACRNALRQIEEKKYNEKLYEDGMEKVLGYGVACCRKRCRMICVEL